MTDSARYTHGHHESVLRSHRWRTAENSAGYLLDALTPGATVLDVGCGPGTITLDLAHRQGPGRVVGIDPAADAVAAARAADPGGTARFEIAALDRLGEVDDLRDRRFDVVHAHQVLQHVADPVGLLRQMAARTTPGGLVAARDSDYRAMAWYPRRPELDWWMELYQRAARANGGEPDAGRHLRAWAVRAGLTDVRISASTWCFADTDDVTWWGGMWADRIRQSALAGQLTGSGWASPGELEAISTAWREWAAHPEAMFVITHGELLARAG